MVIFPNPVTNIINIDLQRMAKGEALLTIFNTLGMKVYEQKLKEGIDQLRLSADNFEPGQHFIQVVSKDVTLTKSLMILR